MSLLRPFSDEQLRLLVNLRQRYGVWVEREHEHATMPYDLRRKTVSGSVHLHEIRDRSGNGKSLVPMDESCEAQLQAYHAHKTAPKTQTKGLHPALAESAAFCRALYSKDPAQMELMIMENKKARLHFDFLGPTDAPVVCLAHALSSDSSVWREQVSPLLNAGWQVLRLDMRGHGGSQPVAGPCTMSDLAADVVHVLDFLVIKAIHFVGLSIGGMIGQQLAVDYPDRVLSMLLTGTSPNAVPGGAAMWDARFAAIEAAGSLEPIADATMDRWFSPAFRGTHPNRIAEIRSLVSSTPPEGYRCGAEAIIGFDLRDRLSTVRAPTLVVFGEDDTGTPPEGNRLIAELIPAAQCHAIPSGRHLSNVEFADDFNALMIPWLELHRAIS